MWEGHHSAIDVGRVSKRMVYYGQWQKAGWVLGMAEVEVEVGGGKGGKVDISEGNLPEGVQNGSSV